MVGGVGTWGQGYPLNVRLALLIRVVCQTLCPENIAEGVVRLPSKKVRRFPSLSEGVVISRMQQC